MTSRLGVTGNSGIDAVMYVAEALRNGAPGADMWPWLNPQRKLILVTAYRRESFGDGIERICCAVRQLSSCDDVQIAYPVHRNPDVRHPVTRDRKYRTAEPPDYRCFVDLMRRAYILVTDSGIQEEAPSLGKPVLVCGMHRASRGGARQERSN